MKIKSILITICLMLPLLGCEESSKSNWNLNMMLDTCLKAGEKCKRGPSRDDKDKCKNVCCSGLTSEITSSNGSTGYDTYTCIDKANCKNEGEKAEPKNGIVCCDELVAKEDLCIKLEDCNFDGKVGVILEGSSNQKTCSPQKDCIESGSYSPSSCERCCVGSKATSSNIVGSPTIPCKCLGPSENLTEEEYDHWSEPALVTEEDEAKWRENCLAY